MPQSLAKVLIHMVFSTKNRTPWLQDAGMRDELYAYNATILRGNVDSPALLMNGVEDHVHILCSLSRNFAIKEVVKESKTETTKWIKKQGPRYAEFHWQAGYGAFSVSPSNVKQVKSYIANQEDHHKQMSFQEEFRAMCERHGIEIEERYVWD